MEKKIFLSEKDMPRAWYNIQADLPSPLPPPLIGADIATIPFNVLIQLMGQPLTDIGIERFLKDWEGIQK